MCTLGFPMATGLCLKAIGDEMVLSDTQRGLVGGTKMVGLMIAILASGFLSDRFGFRPFLIVGALCNLVGFTVMSQSEGFGVLLVGAAVAGVGIGMGDALLSPLACATFRERRTRVMNLIHAFYPVGIVLMILLTMGMRSLGWDWRDAFMLLGLAAVPYGVAVAVIRLPQQSHEGDDRQGTRQILSHGVFWLLSAGIMLGAITELGPAEWIASFIEIATEQMEQAETAAALGLLLFAVSMAVGRLCVSRIVDRLGARRLFVSACLVCVVCIVLAAAPLGAWLGERLDTWLTVFWLAALGFAVSGLWPTVLGCAGDRFPRGGASMFAMLGAMGSLGGFIGPVTIGAVADAHNLRVGLGVLAAAPLLAVGVGMMLPRGTGTGAG
ncbi:MAG: hypothetical protein CMJ49_06320 [Planctomycetaceae bacterium]|nr:hypothetical protein [Planctomycetaceae bacterium]